MNKRISEEELGAAMMAAAFKEGHRPQLPINEKPGRALTPQARERRAKVRDLWSHGLRSIAEISRQIRAERYEVAYDIRAMKLTSGKLKP
jgi:hypothetical protein